MANIKHSHTAGGRISSTYVSWRSMLARCYNDNNDGFHRYGGRGITVCDKWQDFEGFLEDMGERPEGMTLDRVDKDGPYNKDNCRWATPTEQTRNRYVTRLSQDDAVEIACELIRNKRTHSSIALDYEVARSVVTRIGQRTRWPEALDLACYKMAQELKLHAS